MWSDITHHKIMYHLYGICGILAAINAVLSAYAGETFILWIVLAILDTILAFMNYNCFKELNKESNK